MIRRKQRFGPGCVMTGTGRRACDGIVVELVLDESEQEVLRAVVLEVHDINVASRHVEREVAWFLKRCATRIEAEGLTLIDQKQQIYYVSPNRLELGAIRFQQFCMPSGDWGPFSSGR